MATKENMQQDQDEFAAAFAEDAPAPVEQSEDDAFGLNPEPVESGEDVAEGQSGEAPSVVLAVADTDDMEHAADADQAKETATAAAEAPKTDTMPEPATDLTAEPALDIEKETQRLKSWEGRLKALQAKLDAAGASSAEGKTEAVSEAIEKAADAADTPADEERVEQIAEHVESGEMTAEQAMKQLAEDFGDDFVKMIEAIAVSKAREAGSSVAEQRFGEVNKTVEEIINDIVDTKAKAHFEKIAEAHPDFNEIANSEEFAKWIESMPQAEQAEAKRVATSGSAKEIIALLNNYKKGQEPDASAEQEVDLAQSDAMDAAEGVRSTGMRLPQQPNAAEDDYLGAWDKY